MRWAQHILINKCDKEKFKIIKKDRPNLEPDPNKEGELFAYNLKIDPREKFYKKKCFTTLKEHKSDSWDDPSSR